MPIPDVPLRIVRKRYKLLYFVAWVVVTQLFRWISSLLPLVPSVVIRHLVFIGLVFVAVRSFRGSGEPIAPPRAAWRMTGTVRSAIVLAVLILLATALGLIGIATSARYVWTPVFAGDVVASNLENLALVALYINSAIRLHRSPDPVVPKPVTLAEPLPGLD